MDSSGDFTADRPGRGARRLEVLFVDRFEIDASCGVDGRTIFDK